MKKLEISWRFLVFVSFLGFLSCEKELQEKVNNQTGEVNTSGKIVDLNGLKTEIQTRSEELTTEEQEQLHRLRQAASILFEVAKTGNARSEIISGVRSGFYEDESILFKDLFNSTQSPAFDFTSNQNTNNGFQAKLQNGSYLNI